MDFKPVRPSPPPAPLHKLKEQEARRREQHGKQQARDSCAGKSELADGGPNVDAFA